MKDQAEVLRLNWRTLSLKVIAPVLVDPGAAFPVMDVIGHNANWVEPTYRSIYQYIVGCVDADVPPTPTNISARSGGTISVEELDALAVLWNELDSRDLLGNAVALKSLGLVFDLRDIGDVLSNTTNPEEVLALIQYTEVALAGTMANKTGRSGDAKTVSDAAWEFGGDIIPTGLHWFDEKAGGNWSGMITWIAARYKGGKSTLMRQLVLHACETGHPVEVFAAEGSRERFALDMQVSLAVRRMLDQGVSYKSIRLSSILVMRSRIKPEDVELNALEEEALLYARAEFESWPIRVWDAQDDINSIVNLAYKVKQGKMEQGTQIIFLDYAQLFNVPGVTGIYESATAVAVFLQKLAAKEQVAVVAIAQKNEQGVKGTGKDSHSAQISGGGAAPATADFLFQPNIVELGGLNVMQLPLSHSRHVGTGIGTHALHPSSGLFIDQYVSMSPMELAGMAESDGLDDEGDFYAGL